MSAAEPADPARPYVNTGAPGAVIDITRRLPRGAQAAAEGRWTSMVTPPAPGPRPKPAPAAALEQYANTIETVFNGLKPPRTLTDDDTAVVYLTTLEIVTRLLQGSHAQGDIDEEQLAKLEQLVDGLRHAPDLV